MVRSLLALGVLVAGTVALGLPAVVLAALVPRSYATMRLGKVWSWLTLRAAGIRVTYEGLEHLRGRLPCIYAANHQSAVDIWSTILVLPPSTLWVAKRSMFRVPILGWAMSLSGFVPIDRGSRTRARRSLERAAARVRAGRPLVVFPEGTRSRDGRLGPFKKGPFHLALQAGVPVVPIAISGSWRSLPPGSLVLRPGRVRVICAPPLDVGRFRPDDVPGLMSAVRAAIVERLDPGEVEPAPVTLSTAAR